MKLIKRLHKGQENSLRKGRYWLYVNDQYSSSINVEWVFWTHFFALEVSIYGGDGDRDLRFFVACGLFAFWLTFEDLLPKRWQPKCDYKLFHSNEREIGISVHDQTIWVNLWNEPMCWSRDQPWWWHFTLHPVDWLLGKTKYSNRDIKTYLNYPLEVVPGETYQAEVRIFESTWKRPRWFAHKLVRAEVTVEGGVPHPGKGTTSYNQDDDATYSLTTPANTPAEAIQKFIDGVMYCRKNYPL